MLPNPYRLERLIAEHYEDLLREAEQARLARLAAPRRLPAASHLSPRARVADALRSLADRLEPRMAPPCGETSLV